MSRRWLTVSFALLACGGASNGSDAEGTGQDDSASSGGSTTNAADETWGESLEDDGSASTGDGWESMETEETGPEPWECVDGDGSELLSDDLYPSWDPIEVYAGFVNTPILAEPSGVNDLRFTATCDGEACDIEAPTVGSQVTYSLGLCQLETSEFWDDRPLVQATVQAAPAGDGPPSFAGVAILADRDAPGYGGCSGPLGFANLVGGPEKEMIQGCVELFNWSYGYREWTGTTYGDFVPLYTTTVDLDPSFARAVPDGAGEGALLDINDGVDFVLKQPLWFGYQETPTGDADADGVPDAMDTCPFHADPGQEDSNEDGLGDACSGDVDYRMNYRWTKVFSSPEGRRVATFQNSYAPAEVVVLSLPDMAIVARHSFEEYFPNPMHAIPWLLGDIGSDGLVDIFIRASAFNAPDLHMRQDENGGFEELPQTYLQQGVVGDIDGDGDNDVLAYGDHLEAFTLRYEEPVAGGGSTLMWRTDASPCPEYPDHSFARDLDGDGLVEAILAYDDGSVCRLEALPLGGMQGPTMFNTTVNVAYDLHLVDIDADGKQDFVASSLAPQTIEWARGL